MQVDARQREGLPLIGQVVLGGAGFSLAEQPDDAKAVEVIRSARAAGIRLFDSARAYAPVGDPLHNERLFATALAGDNDVLIASKGGHFRTGSSTWDVDNTPIRLRRDIDDSRRALGVERIGLYFLHRADGRAVFHGWSHQREPLRDSIACLDQLRHEGKIERLGLSNVTSGQLEEALGIARIDAVQNFLSVTGVGALDVLRACETHAVPFFAYSPLRHGGTGLDAERNFPRMHALASLRGVSIQRLLLRGLLASSPVMSVVVGASRSATAVDAAAVPSEPWDAEASAAFCEDRRELRARL